VDKLFLAGKIADCNPEEALVYCYLRADIINSNTESVKEYKRRDMLVSGAAVQTIAQALGLSEVAVKQAIDGLCRKVWIKQLKLEGLYQLGTIDDYESKWFVTTSSLSKKHLGVRSKIKKIVKEREDRKRTSKIVRMSAELKQGIARGITRGEFSEEKPSVVLKHEFMNGYNKAVGISYSIGKYYSKDSVFMTKFWGFCDNDLDAAIKLMRFVLDNWIEIKTVMKLIGVPTTGMFAAVKMVKVFKTYKELGIPAVSVSGTGIGKRYDKSLSDKEPEEGF